ncbi:T-complex protein 11-domain-containing protein [Dipodascopsis tothii]|uniref:T-complex protein 11-domain-containing protein n=1 Tax=Dipodascopsis tothii TaxID=44089 RepID=UPI0034CD8E33
MRPAPSETARPENCERMSSQPPQQPSRHSRLSSAHLNFAETEAGYTASEPEAIAPIAVPTPELAERPLSSPSPSTSTPTAESYLPPSLFKRPLLSVSEPAFAKRVCREYPAEESSDGCFSELPPQSASRVPSRTPSRSPSPLTAPAEPIFTMDNAPLTPTGPAPAVAEVAAPETTPAAPSSAVPAATPAVAALHKDHFISPFAKLAIVDPKPAPVPSRQAHRRSKSLPDIRFLSHASTLHPARNTKISKNGEFCKFAFEHAARPHHHHHHHHKRNGMTPPINVQGLRELDLHEIIRNPQLRHDIIFDPQLQFRPNLDGERGRVKKMNADRYWEAVLFECGALKFGRPVAPASKLYALFSSLRDILLFLLPSKERPDVINRLDIELIMQQLQHGVLDFLSLGMWLAAIFKSQCAPMRDAMVDQMLHKIEVGVRQNRLEVLVDGLRSVFAILESMKLDVANHQIRILRPHLMDNAVEFEQEHIMQQIQREKFDVTASVAWYHRVCDVYGDDARDATPRDLFISGLVGSLVHSPENVRLDQKRYPETFHFDVPRLKSLKSDVMQITCLQQCLMLYRQLIMSFRLNVSRDEALELKQELLVLVNDPSGAAAAAAFAAPAERGANIWTVQADSLAVQIAKRAHDRAASLPEASRPTLDTLNSFCIGWLKRELCSSSHIYALLEKQLLKDLEGRVKYQLRSFPEGLTHFMNALAAFSPETAVPASSPSAGMDVAHELGVLAGRVCLLGKFHWGVFSHYYTSI